MTKTCQHCLKEYRKVRNMKGSKYCSRQCYDASRSAADDVKCYWAKVDKRGDDQCWGWKAGKRWDGYGRFGQTGKPRWAHRFSYELHHGPIPADKVVMHICDRPECSNPKHLRLGTRMENQRDMVAKGRCNPPGVGERNSHAILTEQKVREIRGRYTGAKGEQVRLAEEYGVSSGVIQALLSGRTWRHVA